MILTCPTCATRYLVDDAEMRPEGRKVKCASCGEEWRVSAAGENEMIPQVATPIAENSGPEAPSGAPAFEEVSEERSPAEERSVVPSAPPVLESLFVSPITTDSKPPARAGSSVLSNLLLVVVILAVLAVAAYAFRMEIVRIAPKSAPIYSALGISTTPPAPPAAKPAPRAAPSPHG